MGGDREVTASDVVLLGSSQANEMRWLPNSKTSAIFVLPGWPKVFRRRYRRLNRPGGELNCRGSCLPWSRADFRMGILNLTRNFL
jgi:hypothetical protein